MWGRSTTAVRECPRVDVRPSCSSAASCWRRYQVGGGVVGRPASCWRRYQVGGGVVGRPRWYFGQPQYRCPGARDYGFARDYALATFAGL